MDPRAFLADLEAKPEVLGRLADTLDTRDLWDVLPDRPRRILFVGMGSSHYAATTSAARLRAAGVDAVAELAGSDLLPPPREDTVVVAISAGGGSRETRAALDTYRGRRPVVVLTNQPRSELARSAEVVVAMLADDETGGVACRSYQHTLALLLALEQRITGAGDVPALLRAAATASADLLDRRAEWLPASLELLDGPDGIQVAAPTSRFCSAQQSALMFREGPRVSSVGCETGDWSHVDVYLTKTTDYRLLLLAGSRWEDELLRWTTERGSTVVAVGETVSAAALSVRYVGDTNDDVRLLTETLVAELLAATLWAR